MLHVAAKTLHVCVCVKLSTCEPMRCEKSQIWMLLTFFFTNPILNIFSAKRGSDFELEVWWGVFLLKVFYWNFEDVKKNVTISCNHLQTLQKVIQFYQGFLLFPSLKNIIWCLARHAKLQSVDLTYHRNGYLVAKFATFWTYLDCNWSFFWLEH